MQDDIIFDPILGELRTTDSKTTIERITEIRGGGSSASSSAGSSAWGGITGTLSNQTDLQTALDAKFALPSLTSGSILFSNGTTIAQDNASLYFDDSNNRLGLLTTAPTHTLTHGSTSTGLALYNTADQTTNFERIVAFWSSSIWKLESQAGGSGTARNIYIGDSGGYLQFSPAAASGSPKFTYDRSSSTSGSLFRVTSTGGFTYASGIAYGMKIDPTINQSSTGGYTMLWINPTESATGSGAKLLIDAQVGGVTQFSVSNSGATNILGTVTARNIIPASDSAYNSGNSSNYWLATYSDRVYLNSTAYLDGASAGIVNVTGALLPATNDASALGSATVAWSDLFLASGGVINFNNGNVTLTHATGRIDVSSGTEFRLGSTGTLGFSSDTAITRNSAGQVNISGVQAVTLSNTVTLTNKRITQRVTAITSSGTPTFNTDDCDAVDITALAVNITDMTTNMTGTPTNKQKLIFEIKDAGAAKTITWGSGFVAGGVALPTTTVISKILTVAFIYSTANSLNKWRCVASVQEA